MLETLSLWAPAWRMLLRLTVAVLGCETARPCVERMLASRPPGQQASLLPSGAAQSLPGALALPCPHQLRKFAVVIQNRFEL